MPVELHPRALSEYPEAATEMQPLNCAEPAGIGRFQGAGDRTRALLSEEEKQVLGNYRVGRLPSGPRKTLRQIIKLLVSTYKI